MINIDKALLKGHITTLFLWSDGVYREIEEPEKSYMSKFKTGFVFKNPYNDYIYVPENKLV